MRDAARATTPIAEPSSITRSVRLQETGDQPQLVALVVAPQQCAQDLRRPMVEIHRDIETAEVDKVLGHVRDGGIGSALNVRR